MAKFLMLGKYSTPGLKGIKAERTGKATAIIKKNGGRIISAYALIGQYDIALLVDMPSNAALIKAAVALTKLTGVGFSSSPAIAVEELDRIVS